MRISKRNAKGMACVTESVAFGRVSGYQSCKPFTWLLHSSNCRTGLMEAMNEPMFQEYRNTQVKLHAKHPNLRKIHEKNVFCCTSVNFGPRTVCKIHLDHSNRAAGWCVVSAWGNFDPTRGGHLVLWSLGLVIEFPPGSNIFIPSALIPHSNTPIQPKETRYSVTSWTASGIFRWVYNGFQSDKAWEQKATKADREKRQKDQESRWTESLRLFRQLKFRVQ
jgi:hypothetical protein